MVTRSRFLGISLLFFSTATVVFSFENPFKPPLEVIKATGILQKEIGYTNNIGYLIQNGNSFLFKLALAAKYGYKPFNNHYFNNFLGIGGTASSLKDFGYYGVITKAVEIDIQKEKMKKQQQNQEMILEGSVKSTASIVGFLLLKKLPRVLKVLAFPALGYALALGMTEAYDGATYQDYLDQRTIDNNIMSSTLADATTQIAQNMQNAANKTVENAKKTAENLKKKIV